MGKFKCGHCDFIISLVGWPNRASGYLLSEEDYGYERYPLEDIQLNARELIECEKCGSLYVEIAPNTNRYIRYAPEDAKYQGVCKAVSGEGQKAT